MMEASTMKLDLRNISKTSSHSGLLKIPLLRQALLDKRIEIHVRPQDSNWYYEKIIASSVAGFNPYLRKIFINKDSAICGWLKDGLTNDRVHNEGNFLVNEVLFLIHDYLHCWAVLAIQEEMPELRYGFGEINYKTLEDFVFCHLLTEAVATVGLDYWYLSTIDLNGLCDLGTNTDVLTVSFHERDIREYRKYNPKFNVQNPRMFELITDFYCTGVFPGFDLSDMKKSPKLYNWLKHELEYGSKQREYIRSWLHYLSSDSTIRTVEPLNKPLNIRKPWMRHLIKSMSKRLWMVVKDDSQSHTHTVLNKKHEAWKAPSRGTPDFRFTNLHALGKFDIDSILSGPYMTRNFPFFFNQYVSGYKCDTFPADLINTLKYIREKNDMKSVISLLKMAKAESLSESHKEPKDLFFLN